MKTAAAIFVATISLCIGSSAQATTYTFQTVTTSADLNFDQLLGINNSGQVAGYFGDGSSIPEKGFTAVSPYAQANFTNENFPGSFSTEVTGINSLSSATTVGFYTTTSGGAGIGFVDQGGTFTSVSDPLATGGTFVLGVNNSKVIAGYYVNASGNDQGFTYNAVALTFAGVNLP